MSDPNKLPEEQESAQQEPYVPASPVKRIIAWVGVVYMVLIILLNLYPFFRRGEYLYGIFPLMICPGTVGIAVICFHLLRQAGCPAKRKVLLAAAAVVSLLLCVMGLIDGIPPLLAGLGGAA